MDLKNVILLGPVIFLVHDLEEVLTVEEWVKENRSAIEKFEFARALIKSGGYTTAEFAITVLLIFFMFILISYFALKNNRGWGMKFFFAAMVVLFVNVFTHTAQTIFFGEYTPGIVTALIVVLPFCLFTFRLIKRERLFTRETVFQSIGLAILLVPFIFVPLLLM